LTAEPLVELEDRVRKEADRRADRLGGDRRSQQSKVNELDLRLQAASGVVDVVSERRGEDDPVEDQRPLLLRSDRSARVVVGDVWQDVERRPCGLKRGCATTYERRRARRALSRPSPG
jgi:hypothetical protein